MIYTGIIVAAILILIAYKIYRSRLSDKILLDIYNATDILEKHISHNFLVTSCARCDEFEMSLISISTNARTIEYECAHCAKKMRAKAATPKAEEALELNSNIEEMVDLYNNKFTNYIVEPDCCFTVPSSPLVFEQTVRETISKDMKSEVWRRDLGACVVCGSKQNLEFDHVIPVSKGGATSVRNLQLLCKSCNLSKGAKI